MSQGCSGSELKEDGYAASKPWDLIKESVLSPLSCEKCWPSNTSKYLIINALNEVIHRAKVVAKSY